MSLSNLIRQVFCRKTLTDLMGQVVVCLARENTLWRLEAYWTGEAVSEARRSLGRYSMVRSEYLRSVLGEFRFGQVLMQTSVEAEERDASCDRGWVVKSGQI